MFWLVNLYSLFVYIEHNGDESPKDNLCLHQTDLRSCMEQSFLESSSIYFMEPEGTYIIPFTNNTVHPRCNWTHNYKFIVSHLKLSMNRGPLLHVSAIIYSYHQGVPIYITRYTLRQYTTLWAVNSKTHNT